jgi:glutathione S-transferase
MVENDLPSWEDLSAALPKELDSLKDRLPWAKERRFGLKEGEEPRVVFYRDNSSWCPYCERVWLQLEEKQVPYKVEKINMR